MYVWSQIKQTGLTIELQQMIAYYVIRKLLDLKNHINSGYGPQGNKSDNSANSKCNETTTTSRLGVLLRLKLKERLSKIKILVIMFILSKPKRNNIFQKCVFR